MHVISARPCVSIDSTAGSEKKSGSGGGYHLEVFLAWALWDGWVDDMGGGCSVWWVAVEE
jgi:hypothetical protein